MEYELDNNSVRGWSSINHHLHNKEKEMSMVCPKCNVAMEKVALTTRKGAINVYHACTKCEIKVKE